MSRLVESIKLLDGELYNLRYHQQRIDSALRELSFGISINLASGIRIPLTHQKGFYKCRVLYNFNGINEISFETYRIKPIKKLKLIFTDDIEYKFKWENRKLLNDLYEQRDDADDVIIVKNQLITDSSYANLAFKKASKWFTPASPLLHGTQRQKLIDEGKIFPRDICYKDVEEFDCCKLINALLEFDGPEIAVTDIVS